MNRDPDHAAAPPMYVLTKYTRDGSRNRLTVIQGFEVPLRKLVIVLLGLAASIVPALFAAVVAGYWALIVPVIFVAAGLWLIEHRTRDGLKVPMWKSIKYRYEEPIDRFLCGGRPVNPLTTGYFRIIPSSTRVIRAEVDAADVFSPIPRLRPTLGPTLDRAGTCTAAAADPAEVRPGRQSRRKGRSARRFHFHRGPFGFADLP